MEAKQQPSPATVKVLGVIRRMIEESGYPPTFRELAEALGLSKNGARYHLHALERAGLIERDKKVSRGIRIVQSATSPVARRSAAG